MPKSHQKSSSVKPDMSGPLIFISHDSRDADLAEAFSNLLADVSMGLLKSFRSSDYTGIQGLEYGTDWYAAIMRKLTSASHVVCLLTQRSINRPWILYEAGVAKGKAQIPVTVVALGVPLGQASAGPFAQFQNCDDSDAKLTGLIMQLARDIQGSEPTRVAVEAQVRIFRERAGEYLKKSSEDQKTEDQIPDELQKLSSYWENYARLHPTDPYRQRFKLYSFCGITDTWESDEVSRDTDLEDVYYLWADAGVGSTVQALVLRDNYKRIQIRFDTKDGGHASNVAIRLKGRNLLHKPGGFSSLRFLARIPTNIEENNLKQVQLGVRVIDALTTHWIYSYLEEYRPLYVEQNETEEWTEQIINLSGGKWKVFETDGNSLYHDYTPDFSMILAVVIEVGKRNAGRPGSGKGIVEFKDFLVE